MTENVAFEDCSHNDLPEIQKLCDQLYSEDPNISEMRVNVDLTKLELQSRPEKGRLLAIKRQKEVIGYCIVIFFWSNEYSGDLIEIDELNISPEHRSGGIGTQLFTWLRSQYPHCKGFTLQVAHKNERAIKWYQKLGFAVSRNQHLIWIFEHPQK